MLGISLMQFFFLENFSIDGWTISQNEVRRKQFVLTLLREFDGAFTEKLWFFLAWRQGLEIWDWVAPQMCFLLSLCISAYQQTEIWYFLTLSSSLCDSQCSLLFKYKVWDFYFMYVIYNDNKKRSEYSSFNSQIVCRPSKSHDCRKVWVLVTVHSK